MKRTAVALIATLLASCGTTEVNLATDYVGGQSQTFQTSIPGLDFTTLKVYRTKDHPGKLWVEPNGSKKLSAAFGQRVPQFTAMLKDTVEPAYRAAAVEALKAKPGGVCEITSAVPWPNQFAIEFAYTCANR